MVWVNTWGIISVFAFVLQPTSQGQGLPMSAMVLFNLCPLRQLCPCYRMLSFTVQNWCSWMLRERMSNQNHRSIPVYVMLVIFRQLLLPVFPNIPHPWEFLSLVSLCMKKYNCQPKPLTVKECTGSTWEIPWQIEVARSLPMLLQIQPNKSRSRI